MFYLNSKHIHNKNRFRSPSHTSSCVCKFIHNFMNKILFLQKFIISAWGTNRKILHAASIWSLTNPIYRVILIMHVPIYKVMDFTSNFLINLWIIAMTIFGFCLNLKFFQIFAHGSVNFQTFIICNFQFLSQISLSFQMCMKREFKFSKGILQSLAVIHGQKRFPRSSFLAINKSSIA